MLSALMFVLINYHFSCFYLRCLFLTILDLVTLHWMFVYSNISFAFCHLLFLAVIHFYLFSTMIFFISFYVFRVGEPSPLMSVQNLQLQGMGFLPPTNEVCEGYVFTYVCHSIHRWGLPQCMLGYYHPLRTRYSPWSRHPPDQAPLQDPAPLPEQCRLGDMVNEWVVCILLECNLVIL